MYLSVPLLADWMAQSVSISVMQVWWEMFIAGHWSLGIWDTSPDPLISLFPPGLESKFTTAATIPVHCPVVCEAPEGWIHLNKYYIYPHILHLRSINKV